MVAKEEGSSGGFAIGYLYLFFTQAASRLLPFVVNTLVARRLTPEEFGVPTVVFMCMVLVGSPSPRVHFQLLSTIILTSREGFRRALVRDTGAGSGEDKTTDDNQEAAGWLVVPIGAVLSAGVPYAVYYGSGLTMADPYAQAVAYYGLSAFLELLAEPFCIRAQRRSHFRLRFVAETIATLARSFVTFLFVRMPGSAVSLAFAYGQLAYGWCILILYAIVQLEFTKVGVDVLFWRRSFNWSPTLALIGTFSIQAIWKLLLAEGEKGVLMWVGSADSQGVYALISGLGSLFVRLFLQPFEEVAFFTFARKQSSGMAKKRVQHVQESRVFSMLLKVAILLGLIVAMNGPQYARPALQMLYGKRWAEAEGASAALGGFAAMVAFLAVNGITEAFAHAIMTPTELASANLVLLILSVVLQPYFGALGLILANCCTMSIRIAYTLCFAYVRFEGLEQILNAIPHSKVMFIMSSLSAFTWFTSLTQGNAVHFGAGVLSLFGILASLLRYERGTLLLLRQLRRKEA